jgi:hypothetical protein
VSTMSRHTRPRFPDTSQGAPGRNRTSDTRFRKPLLYPLSYEGEGLTPLYRPLRRWLAAARRSAIPGTLHSTAPRAGRDRASAGADGAITPSRTVRRSEVPYWEWTVSYVRPQAQNEFPVRAPGVRLREGLHPRIAASTASAGHRGAALHARGEAIGSRITPDACGGGRDDERAHPVRAGSSAAYPVAGNGKPFGTWSSPGRRPGEGVRQEVVP